jgi:trehalose-6-phosphate synthase
MMKHLKKFNEDFDWDEVLKGNRNPKEKDKWSELEKDISELVEKYEGEFGTDSYGVVDAMYQILEGMFQKK